MRSAQELFATWNVEGLGEDMCKLNELMWHMKRRRIAVLCIQETHVKGSHCFTQDGFLVILSGVPETSDGRSYTGVGFIVAPWAVASVRSFQLINDRLASLKLCVSGGKLNILSAYAPHSGHSYESRKEFFDQLVLAWKPMSAHSSTIALGDLNAKLFHRTPADEDIIGQYLFESQLRKEMAQTNRELLLEVCRAMRCCVANTFFEHTPENLVTFRTLGTTPQAAITTATFSQIDHCLVPHAMLDNVADIWSDRGASLQTQH